jgi:hypothetical protein
MMSNDLSRPFSACCPRLVSQAHHSIITQLSHPGLRRANVQYRFCVAWRKPLRFRVRLPASSHHHRGGEVPEAERGAAAARTGIGGALRPEGDGQCVRVEGVCVQRELSSVSVGSGCSSGQVRR